MTISETAVTIFDNQKFGKVRGLMINGVPYFVGKDVADALEYVNPQKAIRDHVDEEDKTVNEPFTVHGTSPVLINHRDALPAQRNPSTSYKDRLVNIEKVDDIIQTLKTYQLRHERSFVS